MPQPVMSQMGKWWLCLPHLFFERINTARIAWVRSTYGNVYHEHCIVTRSTHKISSGDEEECFLQPRLKPNGTGGRPTPERESQNSLIVAKISSKSGNLVRRSGDCHSFQLEPGFTPSYSPRSGQRLRASAFQSPATIPPPFLANSWYIHILVSKWMKRYPCKLVEVVAH